jgi:hypothetical protein
VVPVVLADVTWVSTPSVAMMPGIVAVRAGTTRLVPIARPTRLACDTWTEVVIVPGDADDATPPGDVLRPSTVESAVTIVSTGCALLIRVSTPPKHGVAYVRSCGTATRWPVTTDSPEAWFVVATETVRAFEAVKPGTAVPVRAVALVRVLVFVRLADGRADALVDADFP